MDDVPRKKASNPSIGLAVDRLARAVTFHRVTLATPIDEHFMTAEQYRQLPLPPEPGQQRPGAAQAHVLITRVMLTVEVTAETRSSLLATARWQLAGTMTFRQMKHVRNILAPEVYILPSELTGPERTELSARQDRQLREFDEAVAKTRPVLLRLVEHGADPLFVLSVLVRYMPMRGTEVPKSESVVLQSGEFDIRVLGDHTSLPLAPLSDWDAGRTEKLPVRLEAGKRLPARPRQRRRPGPAEAAPSIGMALLADHVATTSRHGGHVRDVAELVRVWAPWIRGDAYLSGKHVYNRVRRIRQSKEFRLVAREEKIQLQAEAALYATHFPAP
jgi:hypothetical protein